MKIVIIDYGMGNLFSIEKAFKRIGQEVLVSNERNVISMADKLVIPGVGHFDSGMKRLQKDSIDKLIIDKIANDKIPIMGICLGMQLLTKFSDEGQRDGLGLIDLKVSMIKSDHLKIPHMGWNTIQAKSELTLFKGIDPEEKYYFVHSYCINNKNSNIKYGFTKYHLKFISVYEKENIFGVQFHPEKSHSQGLKIISNFKDL